MINVFELLKLMEESGINTRQFAQMTGHCDQAIKDLAMLTPKRGRVKYHVCKLLEIDKCLHCTKDGCDKSLFDRSDCKGELVGNLANIGEFIRNQRFQRCIPLDELEHKSGISENSIRKIEVGHQFITMLDTILDSLGYDLVVVKK